MCIIAACETRRMTLVELENCWAANRDGAGIMYASKGKHIYVKGLMKFEEFYEAYEKVDVLPHAVHFRVATSGGVRPDLTHPFVCAEDAPLPLAYKGTAPLLMHNGIIHRWQDVMLDLAPALAMKGVKVPPGSWSDTRMVALSLSLCGTNLLQFYDGRFVTLDNGKMDLTGTFVEEKGIWYSNTGYRQSYGYRGRGFGRQEIAFGKGASDVEVLASSGMTATEARICGYTLEEWEAMEKENEALRQKALIDHANRVQANRKERDRRKAAKEAKEGCESDGCVSAK